MPKNWKIMKETLRKLDLVIDYLKSAHKDVAPSIFVTLGEIRSDLLRDIKPESEEVAYYKASYDVVEYIMHNDCDIRDEIERGISKIPDKFKRKYYCHINTLFGNVFLNRLSEFGPQGEATAIKARTIICELIHEFNKEQADVQKKVAMPNIGVKLENINQLQVHMKLYKLRLGNCKYLKL